MESLGVARSNCTACKDFDSIQTRGVPAMTSLTSGDKRCALILI